MVFGHCEEDLATPYQLFGEALSHYVTHVPEDRLLAHVEEHGSELSKLAPALASRSGTFRRPKPLTPTPSGSCSSLRWSACSPRVSQDQPVILILDDLQWADKASLLLLRHLAAADQAMRVLVSGPIGTPSCPKAHPLLDALAALRRPDGVSRSNWPDWTTPA